MVQKIFHLQDHDLENKVKITIIKSALMLAAMIYLCKSEENQFTGSKDDLKKEAKVT